MTNPGRPGDGCILLVEPDPETRAAYQYAIRVSGFEPVDADSLADALGSPQMPTLGAAVFHLREAEEPDLQQLRSWATAHPRVPVIVTMVQPSSNRVLDAIRSGADDVLIQPHAPDDLIERVRALRKWRQDQAQRNREDQLQIASRMATGIAHHFNNLLERVVGRTSMLITRSELTPELYRELKTTLEDAREMAAFVRRMAYFGQSVKIRPREIDPVQVLRGAVRLAAKRQGIHIRLACKTTQTVTLAGEERLLDELFRELLVNACESGPSDQEVLVTASLDQRNGTSHLLIHIEDFGPGLTRWQLDHAFEPFFSTKLPKGRGLGLSVAAGIVPRLGGTLELSNRTPTGARAALRLPVRIGPAEAKPEVTELAAPSIGAVMVIDDMEPVLAMIGRMVAKITQAEVIPVTDGPQAIEVASSSERDLSMILLDLSLRETSGIQVYRELRKLRPTVPILFISGLLSDPDLETVLQEDDNSRFLPKPFELDQLRRAIASFRIAE